MEEYKPTQEEIAKAGNIMTEKQENLSRTREKQAKALEEMGKSGYLYSGINSNSENYTVVVWGEINGHNIKLSRGEEETPTAYVDGLLVLDQEVTDELINKYFDLAINNDSETSAINDSRAELNKYDSKQKIDEAIADLL